MDFKSLAIETLTDPAGAARRILLRQFGSDVIWTSFALSVVLSVLLYAIQGFLIGAPSNAVFPALSPTVYGVFLIALQLAFTMSAIFVGRWLGGRADFMPYLGLLVWLQFLSIVAQALAIMLIFIVPPLAIILNLVAAIYGFYVLVHFTNEGFGLNSMAKSLGLVLMAGLGAMAVILIVMSLFVPAILETSNV